MTIAERLELQGMAKALLEILDARSLRVSTDQRAQILASTDVNQLSLWIKVAVTAPSADAVFAQ